MTINVLDPNEFPGILKLLKMTGGKYIIVENGKPSFVMMSMDEYDRLLGSRKKVDEKVSERGLIDKINRNIAEWKMKQDEGRDYFDYEMGLDKPKSDDFEVDDLSYYYDV